jgi:hypothetical protein
MSDPDDTTEIPVVQTPPPQNPFLGSPSFMGICLVVGAVVALAIASVAHLTLAQLLWLVGVCLLLAYFYASAVTRTIKKRRPKPWQLTVVPDRDGYWLSAKSFDRIRFVLKDLGGGSREDQVKLVTRRSVWYFLRYVLLAILVAVIALVISTTVKLPQQSYRRERVGHGHKKHFVYEPVTTYQTVHFGSLTMLLLCCVAGLLLYYWFEWRYTYLLITNFSIILLKAPPAFLPFLPAPAPTFKLRDISNVTNDDTPLGNMLGYGGIKADTPSQHDAPLRHINWVPHHEEVVGVLARASEQAVRAV